MKKLFIILCCCLLLIGCSSSKQTDKTEVINYNNGLIALQESAVEILQTYFDEIENSYDWKNIQEIYNDAMTSLDELSGKISKVKKYDGDETLKTAVLKYVQWIQTAFSLYEWPVVEMLTDYTWSSLEFYEEDKEFFTEAAMKLSAELTNLDKQLEISYTQFKKDHNYWNEENKNDK